MNRARWSRDVVIDTDLAARTIHAQFPTLHGLEVHAIGACWDKAAFRVGNALAFRFVHRATALDGTVFETAVLPALPDDLPLANPDRCTPAPRPMRFPGPTGGPLIPCFELADAALPDADREQVGADLGTFLRWLHEPDVADPAVDLGIGYLALADRAREAFLDAYGPVSPERQLRARVLPDHMGAALAEQTVADAMTAVTTETITASHVPHGETHGIKNRSSTAESGYRRTSRELRSNRAKDPR